MRIPTPRAHETATLELVRRRFGDVGYDERRCCARLSIDDMRDAVLRMILRGRRGVRDPFPPTPREPVDVLISLFLLREGQATADVESAVGRDAVVALEKVGLLRIVGSAVHPNALIFPCQGLLLATDIIPTPGEAERFAGVNRVMVLFSESYDLAALTSRRQVDRALDLGTGSGVHALLAARHARAVVGVDISPRALAFADFNARLNDIDNARFELGDVCGSLDSETTFGLITANVPWVPDPVTAPGSNYWSGGATGEEILARVFAEAPRRLAVGGLLQTICLLAHRRDDSVPARIQRWLDWPRTPVDVLLAHRPIDWWPGVLRGDLPRGAEEDVLARSWRQQNVTGFSFGLVHVRPTPTGRAPTFLERALDDGPHGPSVVDIHQLLDSPSEIRQ